MIHATAEEHAHDTKGLVTLYILNTSVDSQATPHPHNLAYLMVYERIVIKHRLQRILKEYEPIQPYMAGKTSVRGHGATFGKAPSKKQIIYSNKRNLLLTAQVVVKDFALLMANIIRI